VRLPNFERSRAVLIGTDSTRDKERLPDLPGVKGNMRGLRSILESDRVSGFTDVITIPNPNRQDDVLSPLDKTGREAEDVLFVYFAGHGMLRQDEALHLALAGTIEDKFWTSLPFEDFAAVVQASPATTKIVVLDCCYSGRAVEYMSADEEFEAASTQVDVEGTYILTATSGTKRAKAPAGSDYTAFTGALLEVIEHGLNGPQSLLSMDQLFKAVRLKLHGKFPRPQQKNLNNAGQVALFRNKGFRPIEAETARMVAETLSVPPLDLTGSQAVLIGVSETKDRDLPRLESSVADALALGDVLSRDGGFPVPTYLVNPSREAVMRTLREATLAAENWLLIYYSGLGHLDERGDLFLSVGDTAADDMWTWLPFREIAQPLRRQSSGRPTVFILDTAYAGRARHDLVELDNVYLLAATGPRSVAMSGPEGGLFTQALITQLHDGVPDAGPHLSPLDFFNGAQRVIDIGRQRPEVSGFGLNERHCFTVNKAYDAGVPVVHKCSQALASRDRT
jgi:hypothetical protein